MRIWIPLGTIVLSFFIYAAAVLIIHAQQRNYFTAERSSIAAAVSNLFYRAPLGKVYTGVLAQFLNFKVPLDESLAQASRREVSAGALQGATADGNGVGYMVLTSLSMRLFGPHAYSNVLGMLGLMAVSALAFVWRFGDQRSVVVILYFTSLTVMLFTLLVWSPVHADAISIGGIRYFSLVAILPAFHLFFEFIEAPGSESGLSWWKRAPMAAQVVVFVLAILVRNSAATLIGALAVTCLLVAWRHRREFGAAKRVLREAASMTLVAAACVGFLMLSVSKNYLSEGRFTETVWHRIFVSLGINPFWPYGNLREMYDCTRYIPEGLTSGTEDRNGHCILWAYAIKQDIPVERVVTLTYSREYDAALREAFFNILFLYPGETLKTFFYYKVGYVFWSIRESLYFKFDGAHPAMV
jgi:hypothetical protein